MSKLFTCPLAGGKIDSDFCLEIQECVGGITEPTIETEEFLEIMIAIRSAGSISKKLVNSQMALDFAYTLYLILTQSKEVSTGEVKRLVQKWYVLSVLTGRYSSSPESAFAQDIRLINEQGVVATLRDIEAATLSEAFWEIAVVQNLMVTSTNNPTYLVYLAAQVIHNNFLTVVLVYRRSLYRYA